jgi:hypothetical protein
MVIVRHKLSRALKIAVYAWFLIAVVAMGVLQFRGSDLSLMAAGGSDRLDYGFALIDGAAAAYIGVHVVFLYEILPIPAKHESWSDFHARWTAYLNDIVSRLADFRLDPRVAVSLVVGIALVAYANHRLGLMPDRVLANLFLFGLPAASGVILSDGVNVPRPAAGSHADSVGGVGRARHSRKHRRAFDSPDPPAP